MRPLLRPACLAALLLVGCGPTPITRRIALAPAPLLPSGASTVVGGTVRVAASGLEPLRSGARYVVWGVWPDATSLLGSLEKGALAATPDPARLATLRALRVTEEDTSAGPPLAPSAALRLQGDLGGPLAFVPLAASTLGVSGGEARADDTMLVVSTSLPAPEPGLSWGVWTRFPSAAASKSQALGGEPLQSADGRVFLGTLDETGMLMDVYPWLLATMQEVTVVLQSARGLPGTVSPVRALRGELRLPEPGAGAESVPHTH